MPARALLPFPDSHREKARLVPVVAATIIACPAHTSNHHQGVPSRELGARPRPATDPCGDGPGAGILCGTSGHSLDPLRSPFGCLHGTGVVARLLRDPAVSELHDIRHVVDIAPVVRNPFHYENVTASDKPSQPHGRRV